MKIAVDALGSDQRPVPDVAGAVLAAREFNVGILLVGPSARVQAELARAGGTGLSIEIVNATQEIEMQEHPTLAVRSKKDSTIVVGIELVRTGEADAFVSMGSTGAILTAALLGLQRIPGVRRPALAAPYPTASGPVLLLDVGANTDCKPEWLEQFAIMGSHYAQRVLGTAEPRVALLANGEEDTKGDQLVQAAHVLMKKTPAIRFIGNIEGKDIPAHGADVVVCDGFVGNVALKISEGLARGLMVQIQTEIKRGPRTLVGGLLARPALLRVRKQLDYAEYGGVPLLGVNGIVVIGHGRSNATAVKNAIRVARQASDQRLLDGIRSALAPRTAGSGPETASPISSGAGS